MTFQRWLINLGERSVDYGYPTEVLYDNISYFKDCWKNGLSCYKSLEFFSFYLDEKL